MGEQFGNFGINESAISFQFLKAKSQAS